MKKRSRIITLLILLFFALTLGISQKSNAASKIRLNVSKITLYSCPHEKTIHVNHEQPFVRLKVLGTNKKVSWTSSDKSIASVSAKGTLNGKKVGTATITAKVAGKTLKCSVTVKEDEIHTKMTKACPMMGIKELPFKQNKTEMELHASSECGYGMSWDNYVHGWYENQKSKSRFECYYWIHGNTITALPINNNYKEGNKLPGNSGFFGYPEFKIVKNTSSVLKLQSINNLYKDKGHIYTFKKTVKNISLSKFRKVTDGDPLWRPTCTDPFGKVDCNYQNFPCKVELEIHGKGKGEKKNHGWFHYTPTKTAFECWFTKSSGNIITTQKVDNPNNKKYRGVAKFKILSITPTTMTIRFENNNYGKKGSIHTLRITYLGF